MNKIIGPEQAPNLFISNDAKFKQNMENTLKKINLVKITDSLDSTNTFVEALSKTNSDKIKNFINKKLTEPLPLDTKSSLEKIQKMVILKDQLKIGNKSAGKLPENKPDVKTTTKINGEPPKIVDKQPKTTKDGSSNPIFDMPKDNLSRNKKNLEPIILSNVKDGILAEYLKNNTKDDIYLFNESKNSKLGDIATLLIEAIQSNLNNPKLLKLSILLKDGKFKEFQSTLSSELTNNQYKNVLNDGKLGQGTYLATKEFLTSLNIIPKNVDNGKKIEGLEQLIKIKQLRKDFIEANKKMVSILSPKQLIENFVEANNKALSTLLPKQLRKDFIEANKKALSSLSPKQLIENFINFLSNVINDNENTITGKTANKSQDRLTATRKGGTVEKKLS